MVTISPIAPAIPAATAIQDPAARRFAQAVSDAINAMQSSEGSVRTLTKAAEALSGAAAGGVPPGIAQWLFSSELYAKLSSEIVRVDLAAKQQTIAEALARQEAISAIQATLADIGSTAAYDPGTTYAIGDMVTFDSKLYRAKVATTGNLPTDTAFWEKVGDYATLGDVVAAHTLSISDHESRIDTTEAGLSAETSERASLAAQVRGGYSGTDANAVTQGLIYSERIARASADSTEVAARQSLSAKLTGATDPTGLTLGTLASGLVFDEKTARVSAVGAVATSVSVLEGRTSATEGAILTEQTVRAGNDNAIVSAINTMWAITGATTAISTSGSNLVTSWTSGQANYWNTLNAEVFTTGGQTIRAALSQEASTRATQTGQLYGQYTVKIDTNGYVAGFGLASESNIAGGSTSSFVIRADKFAMVMPGYGDYVPFAVGPAGVSFNGSMAWGGVTGAGRPADNATVGATVGSNLVIPGVGTPSSVVSNLTKIGAGNVEVFIDNAAINNAKIGGDIWSSNWDWNNGWYLQRSGNLYCANAYVRGDVQATSLKVDTANIVSTLHLQGESVTIPRSAFTEGSSGLSTDFVVLQSLPIDAGGSSVSIKAGAQLTGVPGARVISRIVSPAGNVLAVAEVTLPGGDVSSTTASIFLGALCLEAGTYTFQARRGSGPTGGVSAEYRYLELLGCKR